MNTYHFSSSYGFAFGARLRDYGRGVRTPTEIQEWYGRLIDYVVEIVTSEYILADEVKKLLARQFRGLWCNAKRYLELEQASKKILDTGFWAEGWVATQSILVMDSESLPQDVAYQLEQLATSLAPRTLSDRVQLYVACSQYQLSDAVATTADVDHSEVYRQIGDSARLIGRNIAHNEPILDEFMTTLLSSDQGNQFSIGQGLAEGCTEPKKIWGKLNIGLELIEVTKRKYQVLQGFINTLYQQQKKLANELLDDAVESSMLAPIFPWLQISAAIDQNGIRRLKQSIETGVAPLWLYRNIGYGRAHESISNADFAGLLRMIAARAQGLEVALDILYMRLSSETTKDDDFSTGIISAGQELLLQYPFSRETKCNENIDYHLSRIAKYCLHNESAVGIARVLATKIKQAIEEDQIYFPSNCRHVMSAIAEIQPVAFLDTFLAGNHALDFRVEYDLLVGKRRPIQGISDECIIAWCESDPRIRYARVAAAIVPFQKNSEETLEWTPLALEIVHDSGEPIRMLDILKRSLTPMSWSGSRAEKMETRMPLFVSLQEHSDPLIVSWAKQNGEMFWKKICCAREEERKEESDVNERFE